jgi:hypothetical protein
VDELMNEEHILACGNCWSHLKKFLLMFDVCSHHRWTHSRHCFDVFITTSQMVCGESHIPKGMYHMHVRTHTHTPYLSLSFYRTLVDAFTPPSVWCTCILLIILSYSFIFFHVFSFSFHFLFIFFSFYFYFLFMFFPFFPDSVWAKGSSKSGGLLYIFTCSHLHHIFTCSYLYIITGPEVVLLLLLLVLLLLLFL